MMPTVYTPSDWFWQVGADTSRYWSSAAGGWVGSVPDDAGLTRIASAADLDDVLRAAGLSGPSGAPIPDEISDRQWAQQARIAGKISQAEALDFVRTGAIPSPLAATIATLPSQQMRDDATLIICGATIFQRSHPLTPVLLAAMGMSSAEGDAFWRAAANL